MLRVIMLRVIMLRVIMLSVIMLSVIMLSVIMLSVVMLSVVMQSVVLISAVAPSIFLSKTNALAETSTANFVYERMFFFSFFKKISILVIFFNIFGQNRKSWRLQWVFFNWKNFFEPKIYFKMT